MIRLRITSILIQLPTTLLWSHLSYTALEAGKTACKFLHRVFSKAVGSGRQNPYSPAATEAESGHHQWLPADGKIEIAD
jgi:hypothetical protein